MNETKLEEYQCLIDQLEDAALLDVRDFSIFVLWMQDRRPAPWKQVLRGGWLWLIWQLQKIIEPYKKMMHVWVVLPFIACSFSNGAISQMPYRAARIVTPGSITCTVTAVETLNLRAGPGTDTAGKAILNYGDVLTILPDPAQGNWIKIQTQDHSQGWINSKYCRGEK